ncbi:hypothetical protein IAU60_006175 [Kwoniella sp. DSM 27419]
MADEILRNAAALNALKRHQLVSLSKRYGLKASGKNVDMVQRLEAFALERASDLDFYIPSPAPTPAVSRTLRHADPSIEPPSPLPRTPTADLAPIPLNHKISQLSMLSQRCGSESWEVLSESDASLISPKKAQAKSGMTKSESVRSWKSANNGEALNDFGSNNTEKVSSSSSMKALATSLTRRGSRILLGRGTSASSHLSQAAEVDPVTDDVQPMEIVEDSVVPPSPASTVGIPRRHSKLTLQQRPSTVRLCSPTPTSPLGLDTESETDDLPFAGAIKPKERRSMAPLRSSMGSSATLAPAVLGRKSMPALAGSGPASITSIYPPLPSIPSAFVPLKPAATELPGSFPSLPPTPSRARMIFGSTTAEGVSNQQFSEAAQAVLKEMNARLPEGAVRLGDEYLKGRKAEINKLVKVNDELGTGGWGLSASGSRLDGKDRYAQAHQKEFAKMRSLSKSSTGPGSTGPRQVSAASTSAAINPGTPGRTKRKYNMASSTSTSGTTPRLPSAPNGAPITAATSEEDGRKTKRSRLSNGPNYLGSLKEAGRSIANLIGEEKGKSGEEVLREMKDKRTRRRSSLVKTKKGRSLSARFGFLRSRKASAAHAADTIPVPTAPDRPSMPSSQQELGASSFAGQIARKARKPSDSELHPSKKATTSRRRSTDLSNVIRPKPELLEQAMSAQRPIQAPKDRSRSTSVQTVVSHSSSMTPRRPKIPDFTPPQPSSHPPLTPGLPRSMSTSSAFVASARSSQVDILRNARPVPAPPATGSTNAPAGSNPSSRPAALKRSSTLYMPTASSLARMQATIRPNPERPLPVPPAAAAPKIATTSGAFGMASSRASHLFESNFNIVKPSSPPRGLALGNPVTSTPKPRGGMLPPSSGGRLAIKSPAARLRAKHSGLSAVKSNGGLREEMEVKRKRSEIRARQERRGEERGLRELLGDINM